MAERQADRQNAPSQSVQASDRSKAEGERDTEREQPRASGRDRLDPVELRNVRDETSEKHRRGEDVGASGLSNPTLAEQQEEQAELPPRKTRKAGSGT
jgi:hypothetical protein